jgi:hypothetical protein
LEVELANPFYLLADLKGSIRSNPRPPCYFVIDPSIEPNSIELIQFPNLVFDLFGIHKRPHGIRYDIGDSIGENIDLRAQEVP